MSFGTVARVVSILTGTVLLSCNANSPAGPTDTGAFRVEPATTALRVSDSVQFVAMRGSEVATALWTSDAAEVVEITSTGRATARSPGTATIWASSDDDRISAYIRSVPDATGRWQGQTIDTASIHVSGPGPYVSTVGLIRSLVLNIGQNGGVLSGDGVIDLVPCPISGSIDENGQITLTASFSNEEGFSGEITKWSSVLTEQSITGEFEITQRFTNAFGPQVILQRARIQTLAR